ncbi:hypothetical protein [Isoalcanivorax beigongshangi]|uniref:Uncharacterized protein n=1 Tax=Isoalcanivorax beigongshangi TaxID=3238810 RepID=A0ABV4AJZ3_9GAMM
MTFSVRLRALFRASLLGAGVAAVSGCGMVYKTTGDVLVSYGSKEMVPYLMSYSDTGMVCATGESLTPLLLSFESVGSHPDKLATLVYTTAAICTEERALEEELRYMRAMKEGRVAEAQDARARQKELAEVSARRMQEAYNRAVGQYGEADNGSCPRLRKDFDELVYMIGMVAGVQSLLADATADTAVGVPRDVAAKAERAMSCLDNEKWWGAPMGLRAALWNILPMLKPDNGDTWAELDRSTRLGFEAGVRLPSALATISAYSTGDTDRVRKAIRDFANNDQDLNPDYALIDAIAFQLVKGISDRMWTEATGKRTPFGGLGTFWDETPKQNNSFNIDDLL